MVVSLCKIEIGKQKGQSQKEHKDLHGSTIGLHSQVVSRRKFRNKIRRLQR